MTCLAVLEGICEIISHSWLLNFIETRRASFDPFDITLKSISHAKTSFLVNCAGGTQGVQLLDWSNKGQIQAIRLRRVWCAPGTPAFDAEACELANLLARVSQLCQRLNLPMPKELYRPTFFKALKTLFGSKFTQAGRLGYGGCSFVPIDM